MVTFRDWHSGIHLGDSTACDFAFALVTFNHRIWNVAIQSLNGTKKEALL